MTDYEGLLRYKLAAAQFRKFFDDFVCDLNFWDWFRLIDTDLGGFFFGTELFSDLDSWS